MVPADGRQPAWERYAAFAPLISLPHVLQLDWPTLPTAPYLLRHEPPPAAAPENRVGIVWRSSAFDAARDCPLEDMIAALGPETAAVSLQFGTTPDERALLEARGIPEAVGSDFLETARRMRTLAAVMTVDTSVAHVAGALGRPTLLLVNEPAAVRWMLRRPDSPWYPTMRILRKASRDAWRAFAPRAATELRSLVASPSEQALRLNLGCGPNRLPGYVNVDMYGTPDVRWNLEEAPWPWESDSVDEVRMSHVLEHLGQSPQVFIGVMKELYRVCRHGARVYIRVPHPRHDFFLGDPTHVRPILPATLEMFSLRRNLEWEAQGLPNTPLGKYHGIDFEIEDTQFALDEPYATQLKERKITQARGGRGGEAVRQRRDRDQDDAARGKDARPPVNRREFLEVLAAGVAAGLALDAPAALAQADDAALYRVPRFGNVSLLHVTDTPRAARTDATSASRA